MSGPAPGVTAGLFASLQAAGCEVTARELMEILWLAHYVPGPRQAEPVPPSPAASVAPSAPQLSETDPARTRRPEPPPSPVPEPGSPPGDGLYPHVDRDHQLARGRRASLVRAPGAPALPNALALSRALRPLLKKRVSRHRWQLDEEATAEATALNRGVATPMFKPSAERWFEVALVIDDAPSMHVWHQVAGELRRLLMRHGGFRDLRQYRLRAVAGARGAGGADGAGGAGGAGRPGGAGGVDRGVELISESGRRLTPNAISDPSGRRLIVLLSDVVSAMWRELPLRQALFSWSRWSPVVLVDVLPRRMWPHTPIGFAERAMSPRRTAAPNVEWLVERDWWEAVDLAGGAADAARRHDVTLPVISLDADQFGRWARALMQVSAERCAGTLLHVETVTEAIAQPAVASASMTAAERVQHFRSAASEAAYQLACYFAATLPVLPVLRIVQREMMPSTGPSHLAEFLLGGLVRPRVNDKRIDENAAEQDRARRVDPERIIYDFYPGVQELLLAQLDVHEVARIMPAIEAYLKSHLGESYNLIALIPDGRGEEEISAEALPFVRPAFELMQRILGRRPRAASSGVYDRLVRILGRAFPDRDINVYVEDARGLPDDEVRERLIAVALELMPAEQREELLPLSVTFPSPNLPVRLWRTLFATKALAPLDLMDAVSIADDESLIVTADLRTLLRQHARPLGKTAMHRRIIEAYLGSGEQGVTPELPPFSDEYFYRHILTHVAIAEYDQLAQSIAGHPEWIEGKVRVCGLADLLADLDRFAHIPAIRELRAIAARTIKEEESTQGWAEALIEEWQSSRPSDIEAEALAADAPVADAPVADAVPSVWVLIAGTGVRELTDFERDVTSAVGARLAAAGHGLMCGQWRGVDTVAADSFANELARMGRPSQSRLLRTPSINRAAVSEFESEFGTESAPTGVLLDPTLTQVDVVVLIGGAGTTGTVGHEAMKRFVPVVPVAATGGDARHIFLELVQDGVYEQGDPLAANDRDGDDVPRVVDRVMALVNGAEPSHRVLSLAGTYLRTNDLARAERIEARLLTLLRRGPSVDWRSETDPSLALCLAAFTYRVTPDPTITRSLFLPDESPQIVLQRMRACEAAFEHREARATLPRDAELFLARLHSTLDDRRDEISQQTKQFMADRLLPLAKLVALAEQAASPDFENLGTLLLTAEVIVHQKMALDCLADPHPGWRLIGLAMLSGPTLRAPDLVADVASRMLQACRFETTFRSHRRLAVQAIDRMAALSRPLNLDAKEWATLERMRGEVFSGAESDAAPAVPPASTDPAKEHAARLAALVERYHAIRREPSGDARTEKMEALVHEMREVVTDAEGFNVIERLADGDRGWRLAAYAFVQERPDGEFYEALCRSLIKYRAVPGRARSTRLDNRPFGEYHGLLAFDGVDESISELSEEQRVAWEALRRSIRFGADPDRARIVSRILLRRRNLGGHDRPDQVGAFLRQAEQFDEALDAHREWLAMVVRRADRDPGNAELRRSVAQAHDEVGRTLQLGGKPSQSLVQHRTALGIRRRLVAADPQGSVGTLNWIAEAQTALGDLSAAEASYREAVSIARVLVASPSADSLQEVGLHISLNNLGEVLRRQGNFDAALACFREALDFVNAIASREPSAVYFRRYAAVSSSNIGDVLATRGDSEGALAAYREALSSIEEMASLVPGDLELRAELGSAMTRVARVLEQQGLFADARATFEEALELRRELAAKQPYNTLRLVEVAISLDDVGDALRALGDLAGARARYEEALGTWQRLTDLDPSVVEWKRDLAIAHERLATIWQMQGDLSVALAGLEQALAINRKVFAIDPANAVSQRQLSGTCSRIATLYEQAGERAAALRFAEESLGYVEQLAPRDPENAALQRDLEITRAQVARLRETQSSEND